MGVPIVTLEKGSQCEWYMWWEWPKEASEKRNMKYEWKGDPYDKYVLVKWSSYQCHNATRE